MDKKSKVLISVFAVLILTSAVMTYYKYIVVHDFDVVNIPEDQ